MKIMDRRRGRRIDVNWPVNVSHVKCGIVPATTANVSVSGVSVITPLRLPIRDNVELAIDIAQTVTIKCVGQIMRETLAANGKFNYGVRLIRITNADYKIYTDTLLALFRKSPEENELSFASDRVMNIG